jgi:hypothetical protein
MRLWSLHPQYLDAKGLVALWREALLAQAVLAGKTKGYRHHPQIRRFQESSAPRAYIATYLRLVLAEATLRGYRFDVKRIGRSSAAGMKPLKVSRGQLDHEWEHLRKKLKVRDPARRKELSGVKTPKSHALFKVVRGGIAPWEIIT